MMFTSRPAIAFIIQRYGSGFSGGSESLCRAIAERLTGSHRVEVLTTCATDHLSWNNTLEAGVSELNGVVIRRFPVEHPRDNQGFDRLSRHLLERTLSDEEEKTLIRAQGPYTPALVSYVDSHRAHYDAFIIFTYLYYPAIACMPLVADRAVFVPTTHDEPMLYLRLMEPVFRATPHLIFNTEEEQYLARRRFCLPAGTGTLAGAGVELRPGDAVDPAWTPLAAQLQNRTVLTYVGRVEESKGCGDLLDHFMRFSAETPDANVALLLAGTKRMQVPQSEKVLAPGFVSEDVLTAVIRRTNIAVAPSPYESLCIALLESWLESKPALVNGKSEVLRGQCLRANGGLWYSDYYEFRAALLWFLNHPQEAAILGGNGRAYVQSRYQWSTVMERFSAVLANAIQDGRR